MGVQEENQQPGLSADEYRNRLHKAGTGQTGRIEGVITDGHKMRNWGKDFRQGLAGEADYTGHELYDPVTASQLDSK